MKSIRLIGLILIVIGITGIYLIESEHFGFLFGLLIGIGTVGLITGKSGFRRFYSD